MRYVWPLLFGVIGCAILLALGGWQVQRLGWKTTILTQMSARISAPPVALPADPDSVSDRYLSVRITGQTTGQELDVLASTKQRGAVYRVISPVVLEDGRRIIADLGVIPTTAKDTPRPAQEVTITGNLHWPQETDGYTPDADIDANIWFARDVPAMAATLETEPVLVVARALEPEIDGIAPLPVSVDAIPNNHREYAITWFALALVWAGMTAYLLWRMRRGQGEGWD